MYFPTLAKGRLDASAPTPASGWCFLHLRLHEMIIDEARIAFTTANLPLTRGREQREQKMD